MSKNEKVKLTRPQAAAIERIKSNSVQFNIEKHESKSWRDLSGLNDLSTEELALALFIGYEIKEEFKVGDWVIHDIKKIGKVKKINDDVITIDVELGYTRNNGELAYVNTLARYFRHATPEEIAEEKERRWWTKHSRKPWELKVGDVLIYEDSLLDLPEIIEIVKVEDDTIYFSDGDLEYMSDINFGYKVICFAENRLDLQEM